MNLASSKLSWVAVLLLAGVTLASACTIPVFRYALDRWPADPYGLAVNEQWARSEAGEAVLREIGNLASRFQLVPGEKAPGEMDLLIPVHDAPPVWSGPLDLAKLTAMTDSPARRRIVAAILAGNSAVWVLVRGTDDARNAPFEARLKERLEYLASVAAIPRQDPFDPESRLGPGPALRVGFETVVLNRDDAREELLIKMLMGPEEERLRSSGAPFAAPVFGRGRVLGAYTDEQLDQEGIDELCLYLLAACSCQVKAQNPGWDLLLATDWDTELMGVAMAADAAVEQEGKHEAKAPNAERAHSEAVPEMVVFSNSAASVDVDVPERGAAAPAREVVLGIGLLALVFIWFGWRSGN